MIQVKKTAKTLDEGIQNMMAAAKDDYALWSTKAHGEQSQWTKDSIAKWDKQITIKQGKKFIKVIKENGVFAFICKDDFSAPFTSFKKGDVLMAASWNRPALNAPRGNVLKGSYNIAWTGPLYLK